MTCLSNLTPFLPFKCCFGKCNMLRPSPWTVEWVGRGVCRKKVGHFPTFYITCWRVYSISILKRSKSLSKTATISPDTRHFSSTADPLTKVPFNDLLFNTRFLPSSDITKCTLKQKENKIFSAIFTNLLVLKMEDAKWYLPRYIRELDILPRLEDFRI